METSIPSLESLVDEARGLFKDAFNSTPDVCACAPGRVNLIGEHTDYNDGFVLPMALPLTTVVIGKRSDNGICRILTNSDGCDLPHKIEISVKNLEKGTPKWANYVKGIIAYFHDVSKLESGFDAAIVTSVPLGGGLSSSASLSVSFYTFLEALTGSKAASLQAKALACQKAEHNFAGLPCGIMDQFVSVMGQKDRAVLIDCRSMETDTVRLDDPKLAVLVTNSNVKHELTGSEYSSRQQICVEAAKLLGKKSLRDATLEEVEAHKASFKSEEMYRRVRHVVTEIPRTEDAAVALNNEDYTLFGKLMVDSHVSLRDDYEVSCPELDQLVDIAIKVDGVYGSRMTGGGFGGCTVTLVKKEAAEATMSSIKNGYSGTPTFFICTPSDGAKIIQL